MSANTTPEQCAAGLMRDVRRRLRTADAQREREVLDELAALVERRLEKLDKIQPGESDGNNC